MSRFWARPRRDGRSRRWRCVHDANICDLNWRVQIKLSLKQERECK